MLKLAVVKKGEIIKNRTETTRRGKAWFILLLAGVSMISPLATHIFVPSLPLIRAEFDASIGLTQWTMTLNLLAFAVGMLFFGALSDRIGRRPALRLGLLLYVAGSLICLGSANLEMLIAGRIIQGFGSAAGLVLARVIVTDLYRDAEVAAVLANITMMVVVVPAVAPFIGGLLVDFFGWRSVFVVLSLASGVILVLAGHYLAESRPSPRRSSLGSVPLYKTAGLMLARRRFLLFVLQGSCSISAFYCFLTTMPYLMVERWDRAASEYGIWFMLLATAHILGNFVTTRRSVYWRTDQTIVLSASLAFVFVATAVIMAWLGVEQPAAYFLPMAAHTFFTGIFNPLVQSQALLAVRSHRGTASSLFGFTQNAFAALAVYLLGFATEVTPMLLSGSVAALALLSVVTALAAAHSRQ